jgi:membrane protein required for colicin V production
MNLVDLGVLGIVAISAVLGLSRGFVREMLGLGAWLLALYGAWRWGPALLPVANSTIGNPDLASVAAYGGTFVVLVIVLSLLANLVGRAVRVSALGGLDRTLGLVFGLARGALVVTAGYILLGALLPHTDAWPPQVKQARTIPFLFDGATWIANRLPERVRPAVAPPPGTAPTTAAELMQLTPAGGARDPRPPHPQLSAMPDPASPSAGVPP